MTKITVVDAMMGRGKSSAAIRYMNEHKDDQHFLYVTPYLREVDRVCDRCDFDEPDSDRTTKSNILKSMMQQGRNVAATHSLFSIMDEEALDLAKENHYSLIIDEELPVVSSIGVSEKDLSMMEASLINVCDDGIVEWLDPDYKGKFEGYMRKAQEGTLYCVNRDMFDVMSPVRFEPFEEVFLLTYMFDGSLQRAYFDYFDIGYDIIGVETDETGYKFSNRPDCPPPRNYFELIRILGAPRYDDPMNQIGGARTSLSMNWFKRRGRNHKDITQLRNNLRTFFDRRTDSTKDTRLWTTFKDAAPWLYGRKNTYSNSFLPLNTKATNEKREATAVAYLLNRFVDPNLSNLFSAKGIEVDQDKFALADMLQFIWRSAIREGKPIDLYLPSKRMRDLLIGWMKATSEGGRHEAQEG